MGTVMRDEAPLLSGEEIDRYRAEGFLQIDRPMIPADALARAQRRLDRLFAIYGRLPHGFAQDLAPNSEPGRPPRIPEINFTTLLSPGLLRSPAVRICTEIARELHGPDAHLVYDHAIYKGPGNGAPTSWHQDAAYTPAGEQLVGMWVPLQPVGADEGCMRFVAGSHLLGEIDHARKPSATNPRILCADVDDADTVLAPVGLGGLALHNVHTLHSTGPNDGTAMRRVWILNFGTGDNDPTAWRRWVHSARIRAGMALGRA